MPQARPYDPPVDAVRVDSEAELAAAALQFVVGAPEVLLVGHGYSRGAFVTYATGYVTVAAAKEDGRAYRGGAAWWTGQPDYDMSGNPPVATILERRYDQGAPYYAVAGRWLVAGWEDGAK